MTRSTPIPVVLLLALWAQPALAQPAVVAEATEENGGLFADGNEAISLPGACTTGAGRAIHVVWAFGNATRTVTEITDDGSGGSNTYVIHQQGDGTSTLRVGHATAPCTNAATTITVTLSGNDGTGQGMLGAYEVSGLEIPINEGGTSTVAETTGSSHDSGSDITPETANNIFFGGIICNSAASLTNDAGYTELYNSSQHQIAYKAQTSAAAHDFVVTSADSETCEIALVNLNGTGGGAGGGTAKRRPLLGVGDP